jgi:L-2-hydroxyglutarate oxidase LhgO
MRTEFLIIGGGLTGSSLAYWLKQGFRDEPLTVTVVENTENVLLSSSSIFNFT